MTYEFVGNTMVPSEVLANDYEVAQRYPGFRVAYMPASLKEVNMTFYGQVEKPFAIVNEGNQAIVKELTEHEAKDLNFLLGWLHHNDSQRHGTKALWERHRQAMENANAEKKAAAKEVLAERLDEAHAIYKTGKFVNKLSDGRTIRNGVFEGPDRKHL